MGTVGTSVILRPYQEKVLKELKNMSSVGFFMGTGTGKTFTSIFRFIENKTTNLLIICPHNVLGQWKHVLMANFSGFSILPFKNSSSAFDKNEQIKSNKGYNTIIVNYEILHKLDNLLLTIDSSWTIIVDESHRIKDAETKKYKQNDGSHKRQITKTTDFALKLGKLTPWKIILTATPTQGVNGGYIDYYAQLKFLGYIDYSLSTFKDKYCVIENKQIWGRPYPIKTIIGYKNTSEIDKILKFSCRYYESKFGDFEPTHTKVLVDKCKNYNKTLRERSYKDIILDNVSKKRIALKTIVTGTITGTDFYKDRYIYKDNDIKLSWVEDFLKDTNETVAIYYQYNVELAQLEALMKKLGKKYIVVNGATKDAYAEINNKNYDVMLGQFQSASQSLDGLQFKSHIMIFFAMPESSLLYKQALGRIYRDGQTKVPMYYYLVMEDTIEEDIYKMIQNKIEFSEEILDRLVLKK